MKHRLLIRDGAVMRRLVSVVTSDRDGSIILNLTRKGTSSESLAWSEPKQQFVAITHTTPRARSLRVTVHPSGQVNYHQDGCRTVFLPSLFDLTAPISVVDYIVPGIQKLDAYEKDLRDASILDVPADSAAQIGFCFALIPVTFAPTPQEMWRVTIGGAFGMSCFLFDPSAASTAFSSAPPGAFVTATLARALPSLAIPEDMAYIRTHQSAARLASHMPEESAAVETHASNPLVLGPRNGIWTVVCAVQMRIHPILRVQFSEPRYRAETVAIEPWDRLQQVRVQFKVFDTVESTYVETPVGIVGLSLEADF